MEKTPVKVCEKCQATFSCGAKSQNQECWCKELPSLTALPEKYKDCLCPFCLQEMLQAEDE